MGLRENDEALRWLTRSLGEGSLLDDHEIGSDPRLDTIRSDSRFQDLVGGMKRPE